MPHRLGIEQLEARRLLATYVVTTDQDVVDDEDGVLSLREAMDAANLSVDEPDAIRFSDNVRGVVQLTMGQLMYNGSDLQLTGPGADLLTIRASDPTPGEMDGLGDRILQVGDQRVRPEAEIQGLTFEGGDTSDNGGAIENWGTLTVRRTVFRHNNAGEIGGSCTFYGDGGAIQTNAGLLFVENSWFDGNQSCGDGGAIYGRVTSVVGSAFTNNLTYGDRSGSDGGAIAHRAVALEVSNSYFRDNAFRGGGFATGVGSAINVRGISARIVNSTFVDNNDSYAVYVDDGNLEIENSIFANTRDVRYLNGDPFRYSILSNSSGVRIRATNGGLDASGNLVGTSAARADPILGPVEIVNGIPSQSPLLGSPAIDGGDPETVVVPDATDIYGQARVSGARIDIGAVELHQPNGPSPDVDANGVLDCADIDAIRASARDAVFELAHDLNADGAVDDRDIVDWLNQAGLAHETASPFQFGDANLDGLVDVRDIQPWETHRFSNASSWCEGDFTNDAVVDGSDFNRWNENRIALADALLAGRNSRPRETPVPDEFDPEAIRSDPSDQIRSTWHRRGVLSRRLRALADAALAPNSR